MLADHQQPSRILLKRSLLQPHLRRFAFSRRLLLGDICHTVPETPLFTAFLTASPPSFRPSSSPFHQPLLQTLDRDLVLQLGIVHRPSFCLPAMLSRRGNGLAEYLLPRTHRCRSACAINSTTASFMSYLPRLKRTLIAAATANSHKRGDIAEPRRVLDDGKVIVVESGYTFG